MISLVISSRTTTKKQNTVQDRAAARFGTLESVSSDSERVSLNSEIIVSCSTEKYSQSDNSVCG